MQKDFDKWNKNKKEIHKKMVAPFCHSREVWWCSLGVNVGDEQDGTGKHFDRPVLVIKGFNEHVFLGVALTGKRKIGKYYFFIGEIGGRDASAILSQVRIIDTKRLLKKITTLDEELFVSIKNALQLTIFG